ncbi:MAG: HU family DNA-binding protein [Alphaproteobacteria bacterium]|nr:HU family DNA-binding protein [Alphaproteobacteria bacterium]
MNKSELVAKVAEKGGMTKGVANLALDVVLESIAEALQDGDDVRLVGFGNFSVANRKATTGRNPRTGKEIKLPATKSVKFKVSKAIKDALNK